MLLLQFNIMITLITSAADFSLLNDTEARAVSFLACYHEDSSPAYIFTQTAVISVEQLEDGFIGNDQISITCESAADAAAIHAQIISDVQQLNANINSNKHGQQLNS